MNLRKLVWGTLALGALGFAFWTWSVPGLRTTAGGTSITGCDQPRNENAARVCPRLLCQKALREHPEIDDRANVWFDQSFASATGEDSIHVGKAQWNKGGESERIIVRCLMQGDTIVRAGPITADELNKIVYGGERL